MSDISGMQAALSQLAGFSNAVKGAQALVDGLANADQVRQEIEAATAARRAEMDDATAKLIATRETAATLEAHAKALVADAEASAAAAVDGANKAVAKVNADGEKEAAQAAEALAVVQQQLVVADEALKDAQAQLEKVNADLAAARHAAKVMLADHA